MRLFSFIHASDIHLDTPFASISSSIKEEYADKLRSSPVDALDRIVELAVEKKVDFVLLSGDVYNGEEKSISGQIALQRFAKQLSKENIYLFIIAGNHDPLQTTKYQFEYPSNTVIFPTEYNYIPFTKNGSIVAYIHGVSHADKEESRNLVEYFNTDFDSKAFHIGMLHCTITSLPQEKGKRQYVPCSLQDLQKRKINYWALGHIHTHVILCEYPHIVYSGNTQGIKSSEEGIRGVYYVEVADNKTIAMEFLPTSQVVFHTLAITLEEEDSLDILFNKIQDAIDTYEQPASCVSHYIFSLTLQGMTDLDRELRKRPEKEWLDAIEQSLRYDYSFCIQNIYIETRHSTPIEELRARKDLLGETMRILEQIQHDATLQKELLTKVKEQIGSSFKVDALKEVDISMESVLDAVQKQCQYFFEDRK